MSPFSMIMLSYAIDPGDGKRLDNATQMLNEGPLNGGM